MRSSCYLLYMSMQQQLLSPVHEKQLLSHVHERQLLSHVHEQPGQSGTIPFIFLCQCIHSVPVQLLTSRSHSNSIPHHSNLIPVNPEVYRIPYPNSSQFYQEKIHTKYVTCHFQFHTINLTIHHNFWPHLCFLSCILDL